MYEKMIAQLMIYKMSGIKPNYSELARMYNVDRRTVKKYDNGYEGKPSHRDKPSRLDDHMDIIMKKLSIAGVTRKGVYEFIISEVDDSIGSYSNFLKYLKKHNLKPNGRDDSRNGYPRYETEYGKQAQADWKEDIHITNRYGEIFTLQIFNYKLGASRYCVFTPRLDRTRQSVIECLIRSFRETGGVPEEILFDNMSSIVSFRGKTRIVSSEFKAFADDFGFRMKFARARQPQTKGKVESSNKLIEWILPYEGEFDTYEELVEIVDRINRKAVSEICQATGVPPLLLFQKEKEYLQRMPSERIIESYLNLDVQRKVGKDSLIMYNSCRYSVPPEYIGRIVSIQTCGGEFLRIFYHNEMIREHRISQKRINYCREDYTQILTPLVHDKDMIEELADLNLRQMDEFL